MAVNLVCDKTLHLFWIKVKKLFGNNEYLIYLMHK